MLKRLSHWVYVVEETLNPQVVHGRKRTEGFMSSFNILGLVYDVCRWERITTWHSTHIDHSINKVTQCDRAPWIQGYLVTMTSLELCLHVIVVTTLGRCMDWRAPSCASIKQGYIITKGSLDVVPMWNAISTLDARNCSPWTHYFKSITDCRLLEDPLIF